MDPFDMQRNAQITKDHVKNKGCVTNNRNNYAENNKNITAADLNEMLSQKPRVFELQPFQDTFQDNEE